MAKWNEQWAECREGLSQSTGWVQGLFGGSIEEDFRELWKVRRWTQGAASVYTGHNLLGYHQSKVRGGGEFRLCECGASGETTEHYLFDCGKWCKQRMQSMVYRRLQDRAEGFRLVREQPDAVAAFVSSTGRLKWTGRRRR